MTIDRTRLRETVERLASGGVETVPSVLSELKALGAVRGVHQGRTDMANGSDECVEWYAGQIVDVLEEKAWFAVNSVCNCVDKFCPAEAPHVTR
jgi:hypothetical protein